MLRSHTQTVRLSGFTLVEVLVALFIMSIMAMMAWQGVDAVVRVQRAGEQNLTRTARLQTLMAQWQQDLDSVQDTGIAPAIGFDGATLRLSRRTEAGMQMVAWQRKDGAWLRWASKASTSRSTLQDAWLASLQLQGHEPGTLRALEGVSDWQVYFFRGNGWSNAQSSDDVAQPPSNAPSAPGKPRAALPNGVRMVLSFTPEIGFGGPLQRDILLSPQQ